MRFPVSAQRFRLSATSGDSSTGVYWPTRSSSYASARVGGDPWALVDAVISNPGKLGGPMEKLLTDGLRMGWMRLADERRALLQLLGRCAISEDQAQRFYDTTARADAGIEASDAELLRNPYLLFERDRRSADPIAFGAVDRGLFPD